METVDKNSGADGGQAPPSRAPHSGRFARLSRVLVRRGRPALLLLALVTGIAFAGRMHWLVELTSHFRVQYCLAAGGLALLFAALRRPVAALVAIALLLVNGSVVAPLYVARPDLTPSTLSASDVGARAAAGMAVLADRPRLRLLLANVHTSNRQYDRLLELVRSERPDVVFLQEVDAEWLAALAPLAATYPHRLARPRADNFGVALFSRRPLQRGEFRVFGGAGVPSIVAQIEHGGTPLHLLSTHTLPPVRRRYAALRDEQLVAVAAAARALGARTVLVGDLNTTAWSPAFADLLVASGLRDSARGFGFQPTWPTRFPSPCRIAIDHCLHSGDVVVLDRRLGPHIGSDHLPLIVDLR